MSKEKDEESYTSPPMTIMEEEYNDEDVTPKFKFLEKIGFYRGPWFLFVISVYVALQSALVIGFTNSVYTSLETRYSLSSKETGMIASSYDITVTLVVLVIGYVGGRGIHKPRLMAVGLLVMGISSLIFAFPYFFGGTWNPSGGQVSSDLCNATTSAIVDNGKTENGDKKLYFLFIIGQLGIGLGAAPLYVLGSTFLDENIDDKWLSIYLSIFYSVGALGPAIGFLLGGYFLSIPISSEIQDFGTDDPEWVGAWWMGFVMIATLSFLFCIPMFLYPKYLQNTAHIRKGKRSDSAVIASRENISSQLIPSLKAILKNKTYIFLNLGAASEMFGAASFAAFLPKLVQAGFGYSAGKASIVVGMVVVPGATGGIFLGGYLIKHFKLSILRTARFSFFISCLGFAFSAIFFIGCSTPETAGVTVGYGQDVATNIRNLTNACNAACNCENSHFSPICGDDGVTYVNPCFGGCIREKKEPKKAYDQCSCVNVDHVDHGMAFHRKASSGWCPTGCKALVPFLIGLFFLMVTTFSNNVPATTVTLRCLHLVHRPLGMALQSVTFRVLGAIPGPLLLGALIDQACLYTNDGDNKGNCWVYNLSKLHITFAIFGLITKGLSCLSMGLAYYFYKNGDFDSMVITDDGSPSSASNIKNFDIEEF